MAYTNVGRFSKKYRQISPKILHSICILDRNFHLAFTMLLHYLVKFEAVILSIYIR